MESEICYFNKTCCCKYRDSCTKRHEDILCEDRNCNGTKCSRRHQKLCKYFSIYNECKFGDVCKFHHKDETSSELEDKIIKLEEALNRSNIDID